MMKEIKKTDEKAVKKEILFGKASQTNEKVSVPLMPHWNNDTGCKVKRF